VTFRTAAAFSGHLAGKYRTGCSHETVRLLHEWGYALKSAPDRQDDGTRSGKPFVHRYKDPEAELPVRRRGTKEPKPRRT